MAEPTVEVIGAHRIELTDELFEAAIEEKHGGLELNPGQRAAAEAAVREEIGSAVLLELLIRNGDGKYDASDFGQTGSDQAAYEEAYLSADGSQVISKYADVPSDRSLLRVAFFLHFFQEGVPLRTSYGDVGVPPVTPAPERLARLVPYVPVD